MKRLIVTVALFWGLVLTAEPALAGCTTQTINYPDGTTLVCTTCCYGALGCTTNCY